MKKRVIIARVCFVVYLAALAYLCLGNFSGLPDIQSRMPFGLQADKVVHFLMFLPFPLLLFLSMKIEPRGWLHLLAYVFLSFMIGCAAGAITEFAQGFTPSRVPDLKDYFADILGCLASAALTFLIFLRNAK